MDFRMVHQLAPGEDNPRNSEGAFIWGKQGEILFAYSRYYGDSFDDHATCDIALIVSYDEGETWSEPRIIATAESFGVENIMSVSAVEQRNGDIAFYYLVKEQENHTTLARSVSQDGEHFINERCRCEFPEAYYVVNNDRIIRQTGGRLIAPTGYIDAKELFATTGKKVPYILSMLYSDDDGATFYKANFDYHCTDPVNIQRGYQEPGVIERADGSIYCYIRTGYGRQYECESNGDVHAWTHPRASMFSSPNSPMHIKAHNGVTYAVYNPIPRYDGRTEYEYLWGRTPLVIRKSMDDGKTYGELNVIEDDPMRGYCYPAMFFTNDGCLLLAYCRGDLVDGCCLCRTGIGKIRLESIQ